MNPHLILLVFALLLFVLGALPPMAAYWQRLVAAGLACWVAASLI